MLFSQKTKNKLFYGEMKLLVFKVSKISSFLEIDRISFIPCEVYKNEKQLRKINKMFIFLDVYKRQTKNNYGKNID